jgi:MFS family permease
MPHRPPAKADAELVTKPRGVGDRVVSGPFIVVWVCGFMNFLALGAVTPLLPRFVRDSLGQSDVVVGLVVAVLAVSAVAVRPFLARLSNRRGRRFVTTAGAAITTVSFALYAIPSLAVLVPSRLLTGIGQALFFTGATTIVTELAPDHRRAEAVSYFSIALYLGGGVGPAIGERIAKTSSIGWGFEAAAGIALLTTMVCRRLAETRSAEQRDAAGASSKWLNRVAVGPGCVFALGAASNVAFASFMPLYADQLGMSGAAGVYLVFMTVVILVRFFGARLPDRLGPGRCGTVAGLLIAVGMATVAGLGSPAGLYIGAVGLAVGVSFLFPALMTLVVNRTLVAERASAVATFTMFNDIAAGIGGLVMGAVAAAAGYRASFATASGLALCALAILHGLVRPSHGPLLERGR